ncbi:MAG: MbcA/ParS/Xre antitoxin family protein [Pseudomonadota bacterium]
MSHIQHALPQITVAAGVRGLKAVFKILDKWGCSLEQQCHILSMKKSTFYKNREAVQSARLTNDQLERISYVLNMHAALRTVFDNPANVYSFMSLKNNNPYFNGRAPLDIISTGNFGALYETFKRVDALRGGGL